jgi:hypothetical protein
MSAESDPLIFIQHLPRLLIITVAVIGYIAVTQLNNRYFAWIRRRAPWTLRPRTLIIGFAIGIVVIIFGLLINPPSEIRKRVCNSANSNQQTLDFCRIQPGH